MGSSAPAKEETRRGSLFRSTSDSILQHLALKRPKEANINDIDFEQLDQLHQEFLDRWNGEDNGLTMDEFAEAIKKTAGFGLERSEIEKIYSKIDSKESGLMRWRDYITSLSQTSRLKAYMAAKANKPLFMDNIDFIQTKHRGGEIVRIRFIPRLSFCMTKINYNNGRYLMLGREGTLTMWTLDLSYIGSHYIGSTDTASTMYFVDMVVLYPSIMIAVCTMDRKLTMYEIGSRGIQEKYSIVTLGNSIMCLDYWTDLHSRTFSLLVWGDTAGDIHALEFDVNRLGGVFGKDSNRDIITRVLYTDLMKNKITTAHLHKVTGVHNDWVTSVKYIPENKAFLSSSRSNSNQSLCYADWFGKVEPRYYLSNKSVMSFDYNHTINLIVTGCLDCTVRVWNFFMSSRPANTLRGHKAPVIQVAFNPSTQHVISVDKSHALKIFNYVEGTVIQAFSGPSFWCMGTRTPIYGFFFNATKCQLLLGTMILAVATKRVNPVEMAEVSAHDYPITVVCYSRTFEEILTACSNAVISVWDVYTGNHLLEFRHHSTRSKFRDVPWAKVCARVEVTSMTLDSTERCAVTGASDGTVNLWNYSSGVLLANYTLPDETLITGLCVDRNVIFATGWCRRIFLLDLDQTSQQELKYFNCVHREDIQCLTLVKGGLIASASYDGDIIVVERDTGHMRIRLNAGLSNLPVRTTTEDNEEIVRLTQTESLESSCNWSDDNLITNKSSDPSLLRSIEVRTGVFMVANPVTGKLTLVHSAGTSESHPEHSADKNLIYDVFEAADVSKEKSAANFRAFESSVEVLICLHSRKHLDINTATVVSAGAEGWIRAWSLNPKGGLKGQFLATEQLGESAKAMVTDEKNEFLITGDTVGYVKIWDLFPYCNYAARQMSSAERQKRRDRFSEMFIFLRCYFLRDEAAEGFERCRRHHKRYPPEESNPQKTLRTPTLLNVFHAHMQPITALQFVTKHQLIITGARDCSVRIWTIKGSFVGHCGLPWDTIPDPSVQAPPPLRVLPRDVSRAASARTFCVVKLGRTPLWAHAVKVIKNYLAEKKKDEEAKAKLELWRAEQRARGELKKEEETESCLTPVVLLDKDADSELPQELRLSSVVDFNWQDPKKSQVLGKHFKPNLHFRPPALKPVVNMDDDFGQLAAYRLIPISDIDNVTQIPVPQCVIDMENRIREEEEEAQKRRGGPPQKTSKTKTAKTRKTLFASSRVPSASPGTSESMHSPAGLSGSANASVSATNVSKNCASNCNNSTRGNCAANNSNTINNCAVTNSNTRGNTRGNCVANKRGIDALNCAIRNSESDALLNDFGDPAGENGVDPSSVEDVNDVDEANLHSGSQSVEAARQQRRKRGGRTQKKADQACPGESAASFDGNSVRNSLRSGADPSVPAQNQNLPNDELPVALDVNVVANPSVVMEDCADVSVAVSTGPDEGGSGQAIGEAISSKGSACLFPPIEPSANRAAAPTPLHTSDPAVSQCTSLPDLHPGTAKTPAVRKKKLFKGTGLMTSDFSLPRLFRGYE